MTKRLNELRHQRSQLVEQAHALLDKAHDEKRGMTAEEEAQHDKLFAEQDRLRSTIVAEERQIDLERSLADQQLDEKRNNPGGPADGTGRNSKAYSEAFRSMLLNGRNSLTGEQIRALSADVSPQGGFTIVPEQFLDMLIKGVDDEVFVRKYATVHRLVKAATIGSPTLDNDPADADWTSEIATGSEDSTMSFGKREMSCAPLAKRIKISNKLINNAAMPIEALVASRLGYKFGISQEKGFLIGSGANQPLGIFTPHNSGIPVARDVSSGNTTTSMAFDGLISAKYSLKSQHQKEARWLFHRDGIAQIAKLKDTTNQYLWNPSRKEGEPDMVLGLPVDMSEYVPNTFTTGKYVGVLANWKHYWIVDSMDMQIQVLKELYAETNQTGYIGRLECDGAPVLPEAFARVKLG